MALIEFICPKCGYTSEEFVRNDGNYPNCPECGEKMKQKFSGKCYTACGGKSNGGCSGNCSCCGGCHK